MEGSCRNYRNYHLIAGMLIISLYYLLNHLVVIPDFISGFLLGLGLSLEIFGIVKAGKELRKNNYKFSAK